jgi:hypothetical protein
LSNLGAQLTDFDSFSTQFFGVCRKWIGVVIDGCRLLALDLGELRNCHLQTVNFDFLANDDARDDQSANYEKYGSMIFRHVRYQVNESIAVSEPPNALAMKSINREAFCANR